MKHLALDEKTIAYFKRQEKYNKPICTIYIDAHGIESTNQKTCKSDSAKVFSFAGVSGAVAYAKKYEKNGKMVPSSVYYRELLNQVPDLPIKERTKEMTKRLKPVLEKVVNEIPQTNEIDKWTRKNYKKYGLSSMKQLMKKNYYFSDTSESRDKYSFGIYVLDVHMREKDLVGRNIISNDFLFEFGDKYPEVIHFLEELADTEENRILSELEEEAGIVNENSVLFMSFEDIIKLLSLLGFEYTYIFDDSCRSTKESPDIRLAMEERISSLKKLPFKMRSADTRSRTRSRTGQTRSRARSRKSQPFVKDVRKQFHKKIDDYVCETLYREVHDIDAEIHLMEDTDKKMVFHLFLDDEKLVVEVILDFLKITEIKYDKYKNEIYEQFIENIMPLVGKTNRTL